MIANVHTYSWSYILQRLRFNVLRMLTRRSSRLAAAGESEAPIAKKGMFDLFPAYFREAYQDNGICWYSIVVSARLKTKFKDIWSYMTDLTELIFFILQCVGFSPFKWGKLLRDLALIL